MQASYPGGDWSNQAALLTLHVIPPWWRTWWFYTALLLAACGLVHGLYGYRMGQVLKMERIRTAIARDLHNDIGATLSALSIYANVARQQLDQPGGNPAALLEKIKTNSHRLTVAVRDMIWSINARPGDFGGMLSRMREHAADLFEAKLSTLNIDFPDHPAQLRLPVEKWRDFYLIYKEALNNMAKYAQAGQVWISLRKSQDHLELCVKDDGVGFDAGRARHGGNGLANMKTRAAAIGGSLVIASKPGEGTTVTLRV